MESAARREPGAARPLELVRTPYLVPSSEPREHYPALRAVRTLAMLSIVGYHVAWEPILGVAFGLTSLQIILCALAARSGRRSDFAQFATKRSRRLLLPWITWSGIYVGFELVRAWRSGTSFGAPFADLPWASGGSFHLWFLPFGFAASLLAARSVRLLPERSPWAGVAVTTTLAAGLLLSNGALHAGLDPAAPFDLWLDGSPAVGFGLGIAAALGLSRPRDRRAALFFVSLVACAVAFSTHGTLEHPLALRYALATSVACAGFALHVGEHPLLARLASYNLGVYLVHMLAIRVVDHVPGIDGAPVLLHTALVYAACLAAVWVLRRTPRTAWLA